MFWKEQFDTQWRLAFPSSVVNMRLSLTLLPTCRRFKSTGSFLLYTFATLVGLTCTLVNICRRSFLSVRSYSTPSSFFFNRCPSSNNHFVWSSHLFIWRVRFVLCAYLFSPNLQSHIISWELVSVFVKALGIGVACESG